MTSSAPCKRTVYCVQIWYPQHLDELPWRTAVAALCDPPIPNLLSTLQAAQKFAIDTLEAEGDGEPFVYVWECTAYDDEGREPTAYELRLQNPDINFAARITVHEVV